jgi:hypothetical protein
MPESNVRVKLRDPDPGRYSDGTHVSLSRLRQTRLNCGDDAAFTRRSSGTESGSAQRVRTLNLYSGNGSGFAPGVDLAMGTVAHLIPAKDRKGRFSGYYKCSLCVAEFRQNPKDPAELSRTFAAHVRLSHLPLETQGKDVSPAARAYRRR